MRRILVPIDFSENSLNALKYGIEIANKLSANLRIMHVNNKRQSLKYVQKNVDMMLGQDVEDLLAKVEDEFKEGYLVPGGTFDYKVREGNVFKEVANQAKYDDATLIIIGTHGASGFEDKIIGSNAYRLVSSASVPVLTIPPQRKWSGIEKIILPISSSQPSRQKVPAVVGLAKAFNAKIFVVGVKEKGYGLLYSRVRVFVKQAVKFIQKNTDLQVESVVLPTGSRAELLLEFAKEKQGDVIASHIHHPFSIFEPAFRPYVNHLINESPCPVLSIPTKE